MVASSAQRLAFINFVRRPVLLSCETFMETSIASTRFNRSQCIVYTLAKNWAGELGIHTDPEMVNLHNSWRSAEFEYAFTEAMPKPSVKGQKPDPDVTVKTRFKVIKKSGLIEVVAAFIGEDGVQYGNEKLICKFQRPQPVGNDDGGGGGGGVFGDEEEESDDEEDSDGADDEEDSDGADNEEDSDGGDDEEDSDGGDDDGADDEEDSDGGDDDGADDEEDSGSDSD